MKKLLILSIIIYLISSSILIWLNTNTYSLELKIKLKIPMQEECHLYYDMGNGYQSEALKYKSDNSNDFKEAIFKLPQGSQSIKNLRINFMSGLKEIRFIQIKSLFNQYTWKPEDIVRDFTVSNEGDILQAGGNIVGFYGRSHSPSIINKNNLNDFFLKAFNKGLLLKRIGFLLLNLLFCILLYKVLLYKFPILNVLLFKDFLHGLPKLGFLNLSFFIILFFPVLLNLFGIISGISIKEKRDVISNPPKVVFSIYEFPAKTYEDYYNNNFILREQFIGIYQYIKISIFNTSISTFMHVGKNFWFFMNLQDYWNSEYNETRVGDHINGALHFNQLMTENKIKYLFMIAPNKSSIYPEFLSPQLRNSKNLYNYDLVLSSLKKKTNVVFVDTKEILLKNKSKQRLYHKTDTHCASVQMKSEF